MTQTKPAAAMPREISMPVGVVVRRSPGSTRWAQWQWRPVALLPGASDARWRELRSQDDVAEFHAATVSLVLHRAETEAYRVALASDPPSAYVVMVEDGDDDFPWRVRLVTASPFEAQDCLDSGEESVDPVPMPPGLVAWVRDFVDAHHVDEPFRKRRRDRVDTDRQEDGKGDPRIRQTSDVYRTPGARRP